MGLLSVLGVGTKSLAMAQTGMDLSGQNISNADVDGYSRKRMNMAADYRYDDQFGQMGFGVSVINIERMRDVYIDKQIRRQNQEVGYYTEVDHAYERIENILTEPGDTGLLAYIDQFFDSWQNLANNPADSSARTMVKTNAEILTEIFHNLAGELRDLRQTRNDEIGQRVEKVNELAAEIYNLNKEIAAVEVSGQNANDSRDRRDLLLKQLSELIDIETVENELGQVTVTTAGNLLVSPVYYQELELTTSSYQLADGTTVVDIGVRFKDSRRPCNPLGGQLKGLIDSRDTVIPEFQDYLDTLATSLVEKVNELHGQGFNLMGYSGIQFFDPSVTGASDIAVSASILSTVQNIAAASGGETQSASSSFAAGTLNFGNAPASLGNRNVVSGTVVVSTGAGATLTEDVDYHIDYVGGTIQMLHAGYDGQAINVAYGYNDGGYRGAGDNANAIAIAQLRQTLTMDPDALGNAQSTFAEYYSAFIGRLGLNRNEAGSNLETREFLVEQYQTHQDAISGVSLDEEMANLIKYQHVFQASARMISVASDMLDVLMNM